MIKRQWNTFLAMVWKELIVITRYPVEFVASFGQVFIIVAIFTLGGMMFSPRGGGAGGESLAAGVVIYGYILFLFMGDTLWNIGYNVRNEQLQGTLEQLYLSPASKFASLIARVANLLAWTGLISIAGAALMSLMIGRLPFHNPVLGLYLLAFCLMGTFGVGFAFAALTLRLRETAQTMANLLQFSFMVVCAYFFPFSAMPGPVLAISKLLPLAYGVDAFRSTLMGFPPGFPELAPIQDELVIVTLFGLLMPVIGYYLYKRAEQEARSKGSLSNY